MKVKKHRPITLQKLHEFLTNAMDFVQQFPYCEVALRDFKTDLQACPQSKEEYQYLAVSSDGISCALIKSVGPNRTEKLEMSKCLDNPAAELQIAAFLGLGII